MAQIIKHRRGSLEKLSQVTGSLQKGELLISTGSSNLSNVTNGQSLVFASHEDGAVKAVNRVLRGSNPNIFSGSIYNGMVDGVPFYASSSKTLFLLGSDSNEAIDLTGNISAFSQSVDSRLDSIETSLGGGGSLGTRVANLETISASYLGFTQSYYTDSASFDSRISASAASQTALSGAVATTISNLSSSVETSISSSVASINNTITTLSTSVDSRLDAEEFKSTTFATTGSNTFVGTQTITGSLYITQDLVVYGSSSLQNITASAASLGTNTIILNTADPAFRFGGISVIDSGSQQNTGSLLWDSEKEHWIYQRAETGSYGSAMLIAGPKNTGSLGQEQGLTTGYVPVAVGDDHIGDSIISASATKITIGGDLDATGNISSSTISGIGNVTLYSQSVDSRVSTIETSLGGGGSIGARVGNLETISASYLSFTQSYYSDSSSLQSGIDGAFASASAYSASAATSFSASAASVTALSASIASTDSTQTANITTAQQSADGAFASASAYSASAATSFSASAANVTALSASIATRDANQDSAVNTLSGSIYTQFSASAASVVDLSASIYQTDATQSITITNNSSSFATSISASNFQISQLSASVASTTGDFSSSVATQFSASAASVTTLSASVATDLSTLSSSVATSISASDAKEAVFSASIDGRVDKLEASQSAFDTAIGLSGQDVTIKGDLIVNGTTTTVNSTTIELGDNIISLKGSTSAFGGIQISDAVNPSNVSGSLLWDLTNDYWIAGKSGSEAKVLVAVGDNVVSSSAQITISSTTGFTAFDTAISTSFSASNASISSLSASVASVTGDFSSSVATSFSASAASVTALSTSVDSRLDTLEGNVGQALNTNSDVTFNSVTASVNLGSAAGNTKRVAFRNTNGTLDLVPTASVAGDLLQWDGSDFIMSNTIDGGTF